MFPDKNKKESAAAATAQISKLVLIAARWLAFCCLL